jgi:hypothetical protein
VTNITKKPIVLHVDEVEVEMEEPANLEFAGPVELLKKMMEGDRTRGYGTGDKIGDGISITVNKVFVSLETLGVVKTKTPGPWTPPKCFLEIHGVKLFTVDESGFECELDQAFKHNKHKDEPLIYKKATVESISLRFGYPDGKLVPMVEDVHMNCMLTFRKRAKDGALLGLEVDIMVDDLKVTFHSGASTATIVHFASGLAYMLFRLEMEKGQPLTKKRDELHGLLSKVLLEIEGELQELENDAEVQALRPKRETPGDRTAAVVESVENDSSSTVSGEWLKKFKIPHEIVSIRVRVNNMEVLVVESEETAAWIDSTHPDLAERDRPDNLGAQGKDFVVGKNDKAIRPRSTFILTGKVFVFDMISPANAPCTEAAMNLSFQYFQLQHTTEVMTFRDTKGTNQTGPDPTIKTLIGFASIAEDVQTRLAPKAFPAAHARGVLENDRYPFFFADEDTVYSQQVLRLCLNGRWPPPTDCPGTEFLGKICNLNVELDVLLFAKLGLSLAHGIDPRWTHGYGWGDPAAIIAPKERFIPSGGFFISMHLVGMKIDIPAQKDSSRPHFLDTRHQLVLDELMIVSDLQLPNMLLRARNSTIDPRLLHPTSTASMASEVLTSDPDKWNIGSIADGRDLTTLELERMNLEEKKMSLATMETNKTQYRQRSDEFLNFQVYQRCFFLFV